MHIILLGLISLLLGPALLPAKQEVARTPADFENEFFEVRNVRLGDEAPGSHLLTAVVTNRTKEPRTLAIDIRTEGFGFSLRNWQDWFFFPLPPQESRKVTIEYQILAPLLSKIRLRFGESSDYEIWMRRQEKERQKTSPRVTWYGTKEYQAKAASLPEEALRDSATKYALDLTPISPESLAAIKLQLPEMTKESRAKESLRARLRELFLGARKYPQDYEFRHETWTEDSRDLISEFEGQEVTAEPFSISADAGNRISAFVATRKGEAGRKKPMVLLLTGNPPGTKEWMDGTAIYLAKLGFHAVGVDRRETSRLLDKKEKFLTSFSDPVSDVFRLLDFLTHQTKYPISKIGIYGISAGAGEGKFVAALDDRITAVVLACGIASNKSFFEDVAWVPTYSGMIIFPELGLGNFNIGKHTEKEFLDSLSKVTPEHNARAREIFSQLFPYFDDMDPLRVTPLIAPIPLLIVSGAQDDQFKPSGVVEVDQATQEAYRKYGLSVCSELYFESRAGHTVDARAGSVIAAFFDRWLK